jgi:hypothetical protein
MRSDIGSERVNVNFPQIPSILHTQLTPQNFLKEHTSWSCHQYLDSQKSETGRPSHDWSTGHCLSSQAKVLMIPLRLDLPQTSGKAGKKETFCSGCEVCSHLSLGTETIFNRRTLVHSSISLSIWSLKQIHPPKHCVLYFSPSKKYLLDCFGLGQRWRTYLGVSAHNCRQLLRHAFTCRNLGLLQSYFQIFQ